MGTTTEIRISSTQAKDAIYKAHSISSSASEIDSSVIHNSISNNTKINKYVGNLIAYKTNNFLFVGSSITALAFPEFYMKPKIDSYFGVNSNVYNRAVGGTKLEDLALSIESTLNEFVHEDMIVWVDIGGNDISADRPFTNLTALQKYTYKKHINTIVTAIKNKGYIPVLVDMSYREYSNADRKNEQNGSLPFNENIWKSEILYHTPDFAYSNGESIFQMYNFFYNNPSIFSDAVHPNERGKELLRERFCETIGIYNYYGIFPSSKLLKSMPSPTGMYKVSLGGFVKHTLEYINQVGVSNSDILDTKGFNTGVYAELSGFTASNGTGAQTGRDLGFLNDLQFKNSGSTSESATVKLTGLKNDKTYLLRLSGSRATTALRETNITINSVTKSYKTSDSSGGNLTDGVEFSLQPTSGEILINVSVKSGGYAYLNGFDLIEL